MPQIDRLSIFLASPSDVKTERRYVKQVVEDVNRTVASVRDVVLKLVRWEDDAFPGYGNDAQAIINAQIAEMATYALFIGIMWNRLGTPTPRAESGTVEEFERAVEAFKRTGNPDIWFYFRQAASKLDTEEQLEQRRKVLAFKNQVQAGGIPWTYTTPSDFQNKFRSQLILWLNTRLTKPENFTKFTIQNVNEFSIAFKDEDHLTVHTPSGHQLEGKLQMDKQRARIIRMFNRHLPKGHIVEKEELEILGVTLYEMVFSNEIRTAFEATLNAILSHPPARLRLNLEFDTASAQFASIPWEYIFRESNTPIRDAFIATICDVVMTRHIRT